MKMYLLCYSWYNFQDHLKRFDQQLQDHQQYSEAHTEAKAWLDATKDKLSVFADTTGDKYTIQTQLEKLQVRRPS